MVFPPMGASWLVTAYSAAGWWRAFRWTEAGGLQDIGTLPGFVGGYAYGVSADGAVVVGYALQSARDNWRAFRWTAFGRHARPRRAGRRSGAGHMLSPLTGLLW
jgi:probable HAF family extracellular repeat protein